MSDFQRINPAEVPDQFLRLNLEPCTETYTRRKVLPERGACGCLLAEQYAHRTSVEQMFEFWPRRHGDFSEPLGLTDGYCYGLNDGWEYGDAWEHRYEVHVQSEQYRAGVKDGRAAREACAARGMIAGFA